MTKRIKMLLPCVSQPREWNACQGNRQRPSLQVNRGPLFSIVQWCFLHFLHRCILYTFYKNKYKRILHYERSPLYSFSAYIKTFWTSGTTTGGSLDMWEVSREHHSGLGTPKRPTSPVDFPYYMVRESLPSGECGVCLFYLTWWTHRDYPGNKA